MRHPASELRKLQAAKLSSVWWTVLEILLVRTVPVTGWPAESTWICESVESAERTTVISSDRRLGGQRGFLPFFSPDTPFRAEEWQKTPFCHALP